MYAKFTIEPEHNMDELLRHLCFNNYSYECIGRNIYISEDDMDYVETILKDWGYGYMLNDE